MRTCSTARMSFTNASTFVALISVIVNKTCTLLMGNAEVFDNFRRIFPGSWGITWNNILLLVFLYFTAEFSARYLM